MAQVAEALAAAHQSGVIHRDIKPDNVMVRPDGYVKVLDFGLVKLMEVSSDRQDVANTQIGVAMGTLSYMSPEQAAGEPIDHRTDIWSLGVVLYELVTGQRPFTGESRQATINSILSQDPEAASVINPNLPAELDQVLNKALEKDRELRYQTASDFRADIRRVLRAIDSSPSGSQVGPRARAGSSLRLRWLWPHRCGSSDRGGVVARGTSRGRAQTHAIGPARRRCNSRATRDRSLSGACSGRSELCLCKQ